MLNWVAMLDLVCVPALLAGGFIRIGNFFNQEIVGIASSVPWAILFQNPANGLPAVPRHPVQLYEALFYFAFFGVLLALRKQVPKMYQIGKISGLFFIGTFVFRFLIEFFKVKQSILISRVNPIDMGQWLSLPLLIIGFFLFFVDQSRLRAYFVKRHDRL
jgi:prolipoprotein diacylglyceryl transferase